MGAYSSEPGIDPIRIRTYRQERRERGWGLPAATTTSREPVLYSDFFSDDRRHGRLG